MVDACSYCYSLLKSGGAKFRKWWGYEKKWL
jgi:hypothetical protein